MKLGGGDFSAEAYEQLREAYNKEESRQVDDEKRGTELMGQNYGLETAPVDSPWADKIDLWEYPNGKQPLLDEKQSPDEILQIMRDAAQERIDAKVEDVEEEEVEEEEEEETVAEEEVDTEDDDDDEEEEEEDDGDEEEEEVEEEETEEEEDEVEEETEEEVEEEEDLDAEELAAQIAELRAEIDGMQFVPEEPANDE